MTISLSPVDATYVDFSAVEDVERERLLLTFANNNCQLMLRVDLRYGALAPRLVVDYESSGTDWELRNLRKRLTRQYYIERVHRSTAKKFVDAVALLVVPDWPSRFKGWTYRRVLEELEIVVDAGNKHRSSWLAVGNRLHVEYGIGDSNPLKEGLGDFGRIVSIESIKLEPTSLVSRQHIGHLAEM